MAEERILTNGKVPMAAVLSKELLESRLREDLIISPILEPREQIGEGSVDITLGTRFIVSQRSEVPDIDPEKLTTQEIRKFQRSIIVPFGQKFALHPSNFVLGCTFEFIGLPKDLCGFVLSRSSYGRAGLLIATATYVYPGWQGCLTLELENLGEVPIILRPGSTVGQLVLMNSAPLARIRPFKWIPVGPMFTSLADHARWKKLHVLTSA